MVLDRTAGDIKLILDDGTHPLGMLIDESLHPPVRTRTYSPVRSGWPTS